MDEKADAKNNGLEHMESENEGWKNEEDEEEIKSSDNLIEIPPPPTF